MSFVSEGTEEQVESAAAIALAAYVDVPLSRVTVTATVDRRLMTARELTISQSWTVVYEILADETTIDRVHDLATELSDAANATALGSFAGLLRSALSDEGVENSELQVIHTAPQRERITASTTSTEEDLFTTTGDSGEASGVLVSITISVAIFLCALAACFVKYSQWRKSQQRAQEDIVLSLDDSDDDSISRASEFSI